MPRVGHLNKFQRDQHRTSTSSLDYYNSDNDYDEMPPLEEDSYICPDCRTDKKCEYCQDKIDSQNSFRRALACLERRPLPTNTRNPEPQSDSRPSPIVIQHAPCDQVDVEFSVQNVKCEPEHTIELEFDTKSGMFIGSMVLKALPHFNL